MDEKQYKEMWSELWNSFQGYMNYDDITIGDLREIIRDMEKKYSSLSKGETA